MSTGRWNDTFLNSLRTVGDPLADQYVRAILADGEKKRIGELFRSMDSNNATPPAEAFPELAEFFQATHTIPSYVDKERIRRGEEVFMRHIFEGALVLLAKSLPEGYAAPNLSLILSISDHLRNHPYKRLLATLEMVLNVSVGRGFEHGGRAVITAQKLRLLHSGVRLVAAKHRPDFSNQYGVPVNQEDMLATIMGFSYLIIEGFRLMNLGLSRQEEEDFLYLWLVFAHMMGIHPEGDPDSMDHLPENVDDAAAFYNRYRERHYVRASENRHGVQLAAANLAMLTDFVPKILRFFGLGILPRIYMLDLMGKHGCALVGIKPVTGHTILKKSLTWIHRLVAPIEHEDLRHHHHFSLSLFQSMIDKQYDGRVTFTVPTTMKDLRQMVVESPPAARQS